MKAQASQVWRGAPGLVACLVLACSGDRAAPALATPSPLEQAAQVVQAAVARGVFPGAALAIGRGDSVLLLRGFGRTEWHGPPVTPDSTVYDIASLTKVVATASAVMLLVEDGRMQLDTPVRRYLSAFSGGRRDSVTIRHLLTHTSGLPAGGDIWGPTPEQALTQAVATPLVRSPGDSSVYSDVGFIVLGEAARRAAGEPLPELLRRRVMEPLAMRSTRFLHGLPCSACAPPSSRHPASPARIQDPIGRVLGGTAGHAGLWSTASDLARFARMMLNGGELDGVRVFRAETVREFTRRQPNAGTRALGWDTPNQARTSSAGSRMSMRAFGHTGHTGGSIWIDPGSGAWAVLLSNRTFNPRTSEAQIQAVRRAVNDLAADAAAPPAARSGRTAPD